MQINAYQEGTKVNIEVNVRVLKNLVTFILEYKAPLISIIGTSFLQPSALDSRTMLEAMLRYRPSVC